MRREALKRIVDRLSKTELIRLEGWLGWHEAKAPMQAFEATLDPAKINIVRAGQRRWECIEGSEPLVKILYNYSIVLGG